MTTNSDDKLSAFIIVRTTQKRKKEFIEDAKKAGLKLSKFVRLLLKA